MSETKKNKGPFFWIAMILGLILALVLCACCGFMLMILTSEDFKTEYCIGLEEEGIPASEDPFGICN